MRFVFFFLHKRTQYLRYIIGLGESKKTLSDLHEGEGGTLLMGDLILMMVIVYFLLGFKI